MARSSAATLLLVGLFLAVPLLAAGPMASAQTSTCSTAANPALATARATAQPLKVTLNGFPVSIPNLPSPSSMSEQTGPGEDRDGGTHTTVDLPTGDPILTAEILT